MATKLGVYNLALSTLKITRLASLSENSPHRKHIDQHWDTTFRFMLEEGLWNFAQRSVKLDSDPSFTVEFGEFPYGAEKPSDLIKLITISSDANFSGRLKQYLEAGDHWLVPYDPVYIQYISNDDGYGGNLSKWSAKFETAMALQLAVRAAPALGSFSESDIDRLQKRYEKAVRLARSHDAASQKNTEWSTGRMVAARTSGSYGGRSLWWDS